MFYQCEVKTSAKFYLAVKSNVSLCLSTMIQCVSGMELKFLDLKLCGKRTLPHYRGTEQKVEICGICSGLDVFANISPVAYYQICFTNSNLRRFVGFVTSFNAFCFLKKLKYHRHYTNNICWRKDGQSQ
jgi:hypothetical protein